MEQFLQVGVISSTHGLRGEVKVFPTTDDAARFQTLKVNIAQGLTPSSAPPTDRRLSSLERFKKMISDAKTDFDL